MANKNPTPPPTKQKYIESPEALELLFLKYKESLIKEGAKSKKFKALPKDPNDLLLNEFYFLTDYIKKVLDNYGKRKS